MNTSHLQYINKSMYMSNNKSILINCTSCNPRPFKNLTFIISNKIKNYGYSKNKLTLSYLSTTTRFIQANVLLQPYEPIKENIQLNDSFISIAATLLAHTAAMTMYCSITQAVPGMISDINVGVNNYNSGILLAFGSAAGTLGKVTSPTLVKWFSPKKCLLLILLTCSITNAIISSSSSFFNLCALWALSRFFNAPSWVCATQLSKTLYPANQSATALSNLGIASRIGFFTCSLVSGWLLMHGGSWRSIFLYSSVVSSIIALVFSAMVPDLVDQNQYDHQTRSVFCKTLFSGYMLTHLLNIKLLSSMKSLITSRNSIPHKNKNNDLSILLKNPKVRLMICIKSICQITMQLQIFSAIMGISFLKLHPGKASQLLSVFSLGTVLSLLVSGPLYTQMTSTQRMLFMCSCSMAAAYCLLRLSMAPGALLGTFLFGILGLLISPIFYIPVSDYAMTFRGHQGAKLESLCETSSVLCSILFDFIVGTFVLSNVNGNFCCSWDKVLKILACLMSFNTILFGLFFKSPNKNEVYVTA